MARWTANGSTALFLGVYAAAASYYNLISGHVYCNQTVAKRIHGMKEGKREKPKRSWLDFLFRKAAGL